MEEGLTHLNTSGEVHMVDVGDRRPTKRQATAKGCLQMQPTTLELIRSGNTPKGDLLAVARVAAIQAAKRTWELIPLCHQLPLSGVEVTIEPDPSLPGLILCCRCRTTHNTGVEMESMTAVSIGLLTLYDMLKSIDPGMTLSQIVLTHKDGGRNGAWSR
ncbi:cyclic pyranopterin monophosphate synthase [Synechococcus sp. WH 8020]|uniref:cyclic pyranopterin monophosphate synthase MoaC n=1 Tax=Synechococcus sp. (strain WH8020) TaxID=32052 RepID=UPI00065277B0|nr:cyclic pyranopterin monophosphate synthase MoaC [Synechococcus sp. WH 8020]AKN61541.1 cyclic pyranopterin monophosphate synthase [Synechococcus sp. WH 8020]